MSYKVDWNMKQSVSVKILAQLRGMTEEQQRTLLLKLLDHLDPMFVVALDFAYNVTPEQKTEPGSETGNE